MEVRIHPNAKAKIPTASNNKENVEVGVYAPDFHTEESAEKANKEIANEIFEALSKGSSVIPWCKKVEKVTVTQA